MRRLQGHDGLHLEEQPLVRARRAKALDQSQFRLALAECGSILFVHHHAVARARFCLATGAVGGRDRILGRGAGGHLDQTDGATHLKRLVADPVGLGADALDHTATRPGCGLHRRTRQHNHEFIAADAADALPVAQHFLDPLAYLDQYFVARSMPVQVVDQLETIEIEIGKRQGLAYRQAGQRIAQRQFDAAAIEHAGQWIVFGEKTQLCRGFRFFGDVLERALDSLVGNRCLDQKAFITGSPCRVGDAAIAATDLDLLLRSPLDHFLQAWPRALLEIGFPVPVALARPDAQHVEQGGVATHQIAVGIQGEESNRYGLIGAAQRRLRFHALITLLAQLLGDRHRRDQARGKRGGNRIEDPDQALETERSGDNFEKTREQSYAECRAVPDRDFGTRHQHDARQKKQQCGNPDHRGGPQVRQEIGVREERRQHQDQHAGPLRHQQQGTITDALDVIDEQTREQGVGQGIERRHRQFLDFEHPGIRNHPFQPLAIPSGRDCRHPEIGYQPGCEQHIDPLTADEGGHQHEHGKQQQAAIDQSGIAMKLLRRARQIGSGPSQQRNPRRSRRADLAQHIARGIGWR